ncbi:hypothetical protein GCM10023340_04560 [Nocardioides marinquilinus]|uniref:Uncharacterized protein n=1 Tax=Nocardioides marinquilinus TaxID=1210400 RepID=A0ABP9P7T1_9ACTN
MGDQFGPGMCPRSAVPPRLDGEDSGNTPDRKAVVGRSEVAALLALLVVAMTAGWVLLGR